MVRDLQRQIKQPRPFRSLEAEVFLNLMRTSSELIGALTAVLRPYELTQPQYNVLRILRGARTGALPCGEVGSRLVSREQDVTRLLDGMEGRALVVRERDPADQRTVLVRLAPDGVYLVNALDEPVQALHARQLGHLSQEELQTLKSLLERVRAGSESPAEPFVRRSPGP